MKTPNDDAAAPSNDLAYQCPSSQTLAAFLAGNLTNGHELQQVNDHLEKCSLCLSLLEQLPVPSDPLIAAIQRSVPLAHYEDEAGCELALQRTKNIASSSSERTRRQSTARSGRASRTATQQSDDEADLGSVGPYQLLEEIGAGGMGVLYRARHRHLNRVVAIKMLPHDRLKSEQSQRRFRREMESVGSLDHPNVVKASDAGQADGQHFLVMELLDGIDVGSLLRHGVELGIADACEIVRQAALGLHCIHEQGLVHRDIKPSNLMLAFDDRSLPANQQVAVVKVLDMGLARVAAINEHAEEDVTSTGQLMGTVDYISPEQCLDSHDVDYSTDIYSLGATLFRLLTGRTPWSGEQYNTTGRKLRALVSERLPSIADTGLDLPVELVVTIDRMLHRDRHERFTSAAEVAEALKPFAERNDLWALLQTAKPSADNIIQAACDTKRSERTAEQRDPLPASKQTRSNRRCWLLAAALPLAFVLVAAVIWLKTTDGGYLRIESEPGIEVAIEVRKTGGSANTITVSHGQKDVWFQSGEYEVRLPAEANDQLTITGRVFSLTRNGNAVVRISRVTDVERAAQIGKDPNQEANRDSPNVASRTRVVANLNDSGRGSLRQEVNNASSGATIRFNESLAGQSIVLTSGQILIDNDLSIDASNLAAPITIDAGGVSRVIKCTGRHRVSLSHLVITGGNATDEPHGGGILSEAELKLTKVIVTGNAAVFEGGGISITRSSHLTMVNCTVSDNRAPTGGGVHTQANYSIRSSTISGNRATHESGGLYQRAGQGTIVNSTFTGNSAPNGTALTAQNASNLLLRNVTIVNNTPSAAAPAYAVFITNGSRIELENCVVAANGHLNSYDLTLAVPDSTVTTTGRNLIGRFASKFGHVLDADVIIGSDAMPLDPRLAQLGDYGGPVMTMPPLSNSPLIDAGVDVGVPITVDARGLHRPIDGDHDGTAEMDVGAVEFNPKRDHNLTPMRPSLATSAAVTGGAEEPPRRLVIQHTFVRNEGKPETLQRSECQIIPFATYPTFALDSPKHKRAVADWERVLASQNTANDNEFVLPDWMKDPRRVPLPATGPTQRKVSIECTHGNIWCSAKFDNNKTVLELHDDPSTADRDETLEIGFLFITRFYTASDSVEYFEFKTLEELFVRRGPTPAIGYKPRELYTAKRADPSADSDGVKCGEGRFMHYMTFSFADAAGIREVNVKPDHRVVAEWLLANHGGFAVKDGPMIRGPEYRIPEGELQIERIELNKANDQRVKTLARWMAEMPSCTELTLIGENDRLLTNACLPEVGRVSHLTHLSLHHGDITQNEFLCLSHLSELVYLELANLSTTEFNMAYARGFFPKLSTLDVK